MQNKLVNKVIKINQMRMFGCPFYHISDLFFVRIRVPSRALILHEKGHPSGQCHLDKNNEKNSVCRNMYPVLFL